MSVDAWIVLWKGLLLLAIAVFAAMAVWVTVAGLRDIRKLLAAIKAGHGKKAADRSSGASAESR